VLSALFLERAGQNSEDERKSKSLILAFLGSN